MNAHCCLLLVLCACSYISAARSNCLVTSTRSHRVYLLSILYHPDNKVGDAGGEALASSLLVNTSLTALSAAGQQICTVRVWEWGMGMGGGAGSAMCMLCTLSTSQVTGRSLLCVNQSTALVQQGLALSLLRFKRTPRSHRCSLAVRTHRGC